MAGHALERGLRLIVSESQSSGPAASGRLSKTPAMVRLGVFWDGREGGEVTTFPTKRTQYIFGSSLGETNHIDGPYDIRTCLLESRYSL